MPKDSDPQRDLINNGRVGRLVAGKEGAKHQKAKKKSKIYADMFSIYIKCIIPDCPLTLQFYISPDDELKTPDSGKIYKLV